MAINREIREDLMRDATAYVRRLMIRKSPTREAIFMGFRRQGGWSVYFGEDPVYQFNALCKLRRVHFESQNYAASEGKLHCLQPTRVGGRVEIQRIYSTATERRIVADCHSRLQELAELLRSGAVEPTDCFPVDDRALVADLSESIHAACSDLQIAGTANA